MSDVVAFLTGRVIFFLSNGDFVCGVFLTAVLLFNLSLACCGLLLAGCCLLLVGCCLLLASCCLLLVSLGVFVFWLFVLLFAMSRVQVCFVDNFLDDISFSYSSRSRICCSSVSSTSCAKSSARHDSY